MSVAQEELTLITPAWSAPANVRAFCTTRRGGVSKSPWDSFNLGMHVGDDIESVRANRAQLRAHLPAEPMWLEQVHGTQIYCGGTDRQADASISRRSDEVCIVMTADCLPVLMTTRSGTVVAAAHAGWKGLCAGVIERTIERMQVAPSELLVWLGPAIGPQAFEVGPEVRAAFMAADIGSASCFVAGQSDRWFADLYALARRRLALLGVPIHAISGGEFCTVRDENLFFSYRRDGVTGRMASLIWLNGR